MSLTRARVEGLISLIGEKTASLAGPTALYLKLLKDHDARQRAELKRVTQERDQWNDRHKVLCVVEIELRQELTTLTQRVKELETQARDARALLIAAFDELHQGGYVDATPLAILNFVAPLGTITDTDIQWAHSMLEKMKR